MKDSNYRDPSIRSSRILNSGFSLVEVMIAMALFAMLALALTRGVVFVRQSSQAQSIRLAAHASAVSYMEQIVGKSYSILLAAARDDTIPISVITGENTVLQLRTGSNNTETSVEIETNVLGKETRKSTPIEFDLNIESISDSGALQIELMYSWKSPITNQVANDSLKFVKSEVP